ARIGSAYTVEAGQSLDRLGTVLPLEKGPDEDEFFLTFDAIGTNVFNRPPPAVPPAPTPVLADATSLIGVRTFDEISATMAAITGVSQNDSGVRATMDEVRQSLPAVPYADAYVSSHQAAIGQLAMEYCHALIDVPANQAHRNAMFAGFNFDAAPAT